METKTVLVTGGAGFIGSHTTELLIEHSYYVTILDNLEPQVHGETEKLPDYVNSNATFIYGDVRDRELLKKVIPEVDAVIHLAAMVSVGQSMYQTERYVDVNTKGTANLLDVLINEENNIKKLIVASSMSIYGEGKYCCEKCSTKVYPALREEEQLKKGQWNHLCPTCNLPLTPQPIDEEKPTTFQQSPSDTSTSTAQDKPYPTPTLDAQPYSQAAYSTMNHPTSSKTATKQETSST